MVYFRAHYGDKTWPQPARDLKTYQYSPEFWVKVDRIGAPTRREALKKLLERFKAERRKQ